MNNLYALNKHVRHERALEEARHFVGDLAEALTYEELQEVVLASNALHWMTKKDFVKKIMLGTVP